jgi:hypothetical protein
MTKQTRERWAERVREWRASGLTAEAFAEGKDFEASSLRWADSQLKGLKASRSSRDPKDAETSVSPKTSRAPRFLPVRMVAQPASASDVFVEVGSARIRVDRGTDLALVGELVRALQGGDR